LVCIRFSLCVHILWYLRINMLPKKIEIRIHCLNIQLFLPRQNEIDEMYHTLLINIEHFLNWLH
jgi:hypothetical protein